MNRTEIEELIVEARSDSRQFFARKGDPIFRKLRIALHPDRWPDDEKAWAESLFKEINDLHQESKQPAQIIESDSGKSYHLIRKAGEGNLRIVHFAREDFIVKVPKIQSKAANRLIAKEYEVCRSLHESGAKNSYRHYFPDAVESFIHNKMRVNVFRERLGRVFSAQQIKQKFPDGLSGRHVGWMFKRVLVAIGFAHQNGWCNCAVLPPHLLFGPDDHSAMLTGWVHSEKIGENVRLVPTEWIEWYPGKMRSTKKASPAFDIHMAASLMAWLADDDLPRKIRAFFQGCKIGDVQSAWDLHEQFDAVLRTVYGKPKFVELNMN